MSLRASVPTDAIFALVKSEKHHEALLLIDDLLVNSPENPWLWRYRAYIHSMAGASEAALDEMNKAISFDLEEPDFYFTRGRILFELGRFNDAVDDFTKVVELGLADKNDYYLEAAYIHRADAYTRIGEFQKARLDCQHIRDHTRLWTDRLRTKADILGECR